MSEKEPTEKGYKETRKENKKKMKEYKEYKAFLYSSFIKFIVGTYLIAFILSLNDEWPLFDLKNFAIAFVVATVINIIFWYVRRICLGYKAMFELDMRSVYNFERRKSPLYKDYNNKLLSSVYFSEGDFLKAISLCDEMLGCTKSKKTALYACHTKILSLFFSEGTQNIKELIREQRELRDTVKNKEFDFMFRQYQFIEAYLDNDYEKASETVTAFLSNEKESVYNSRKIIFLQFRKMLCLKNNDAECVKNCNAEILKCDSKRRTFFSKIID
ncbi:MAG: hypothetical protein IJO73_03445 [Clostridia bacterium]|nr:hypothetical protein [Clostridia bacterium]